MLPVTASGELNTAFMESEIARIENETLDYATRLLQERYDDLVTTVTLRGGELEGREWADFFIDDLFELQPGKSKGLNHLKVTGGIDGIQYLGATNRNNGVLAFVKPVSSQIQLGNAIAFIRNGEGSMGYSIYKGTPFIATSDITAGYNDNLNRFNGNFIVSVADRARGKYNFGYKRSDKRLKKERLTLIRHPNGQPDWDAMSNYAQAQETLVLMRQLFRLG